MIGLLFALRGQRLLPVGSKALLTTACVMMTVGVVCCALTATKPYARYAYPAIWMGIVLAHMSIAQFARKRFRLAILVTVVLSLFLDVQMYRREESKFSFWFPSTMVNELYRSDGTMLSDVPLFWLILTSSLDNTHLCIYHPVNNNAEHVGRYRRLWSNISRGNHQFFETMDNAWSSCNGIRILAIREYQDDLFRCSDFCSSGKATFHRCSRQPIEFFSDINRLGHVLTNDTCIE